MNSAHDIERRVGSFSCNRSPCQRGQAPRVELDAPSHCSRCQCDCLAAVSSTDQNSTLVGRNLYSRKKPPTAQHLPLPAECGPSHRKTFANVIFLIPIRRMRHADPSFLVDVSQVMAPTQLDRWKTLLEPLPHLTPDHYIFASAPVG